MILRIGGIYCYNEEIKTEAITPYTIGKLWFRDSEKSSRWIENNEFIFILEYDFSPSKLSVFKILVGSDVGWIYTEEKYWNELL